MTFAISPPITVWAIYCSIVVLSTLIDRSKSDDLEASTVTLAMAIGAGAITVSLLASGFTLTFLLLEILIWTFGIGASMLSLALRPPSGPQGSETPARLALAVSLRLLLALGVWLSL